MKAIVTGGCGFIGSNLVDNLIKHGYEVIVIDNLKSHSKQKYYVNDDAMYCEYDLCEYNLIASLFEGVDYVFHMAAEVSIPYCIKHPKQSLTNNVISTLNVLEASRCNSVKKVLFSSTCAVYENTLFPIKETDPVSCLNTYSVSKHTGEQLCKMYYDLYGLETVIFRYFNVYGERQSTTGQYAPVMGIFKYLKDNNKPLTVHGDGQQTRDFIHVSDVVKANIIAAETDLYSYGDIFNVGSGKAISILEIAEMISQDIIFTPQREGEIQNSEADISKIKSYFDWQPTVDLKNWLEESI